MFRHREYIFNSSYAIFNDATILVNCMCASLSLKRLCLPSKSDQKPRVQKNLGMASQVEYLNLTTGKSQGFFLNIKCSS